MTINLSIRNYWSYSINNDILTLQDDGSLTNNTTYTNNRNQNFTSWNMDLSYSWIFAPGSQISVLYRNNSGVFEQGIDPGNIIGEQIGSLLIDDHRIIGLCYLNDNLLPCLAGTSKRQLLEGLGGL